MTNYARIPNMSDSERVDAPQCGCIKVAQLTTTVFGKRTIHLASEIPIAEKSR